MPTRSPVARLLCVAALALATACERDTSLLEPAPFPSTAAVFEDGFAPGVDFQSFSGAKGDALSVDPTVRRVGAASLKVTVPGPGDPTGGYAGGAFVSNPGRDLSGYNALTFWVRASITATLDAAGLGNDNTGTSRFPTERREIRVSPTWTKVVLPIPAPSKLTAERGLFFFAEGPENGVGYDLWIDDLKFEQLADLGEPVPSIPTQSLTQEVGNTVTITGTTVAYSTGSGAFTMSVAPGNFTFASSNPAVATVNAAGTITAVGVGTTNITATLDGRPATGTITLRTAAPPTTAAPTPTRDAADVISLFSDAYPNVPVDTWSASFDQADVADVQIAGNATKRYTNLVFSAAEFITTRVNATAMTHLHLDVYVYDATSFRIKLVDFGANGVFDGGGDDSEHEVVLSPTSTPALVANAWNSIDIPLSAFTGLRARANLAQLILGASSPTVYLDNIYFYREPAPPAPTGPTTPAPAPTRAASSVVSLFSNAYTNRAVDTWSADWDQADVEDVKVGADDVKRYTNLTFAGIEFIGSKVNATALTGLHLDLWTPDATDAPAEFKVKLVDFGADGNFGGGDDVEHELTVTRASTPGFTTGTWISLDLPFTSFPGLLTRGNLAQMIISGSLRTVYLDNVYFYGTAAPAPTVPTTAAPTPTFAAENVISLFSNAYQNQPVDTWSADWDSADLTDLRIANDDVKRYTNMVFAGIEFIGTKVNASAFTHFSFDLWTPDATTAGKVFRVKLVDFGADGAFGGGDDTEHEVTLTGTSTPALATGTWTRLSIPLSAFAGLRSRNNLAQLIFSGDLATIYVDNVLFHR